MSSIHLPRSEESVPPPSSPERPPLAPHDPPRNLAVHHRIRVLDRLDQPRFLDIDLLHALLDELEGRGCDFFYNEASPKTGLVRDRAPAAGRSLSRVASIAATGFGLTAMCIAAKRNYLPKLQCEARVEKTLAFLLEDCPHEHGFLYHFIDIESGQRMFGSELSSIDTALLLCGVLTCRQYFSGNTRIEALATTFYRRIDWEWMLNGGTTLSMGWLPDQGFLKHRWDIYAELMTMYLLAIGSPTHPITVETWPGPMKPSSRMSGESRMARIAGMMVTWLQNTEKL